MISLTQVLLAWAAMTVLMAGLWAVQRARRNAGIVDVAWSFGTGICGVWFALGGAAPAGRRFLLAALAGIWGLRLGLYLLRRVSGEAEDVRYRALREKWGRSAQLRLFLFFQIQALWAVLFALPMGIAAQNASVFPGILDVAGAIVWIAAIGGEALADRQLARFRADPANLGRVCRDGLWRYSRHPNYFFEWVHWFAYVLIGIAGPLGWLTIFGPALMLVFLTKVTGIPPLEARAIESRGDAYREYQRTTSAFFPLPPAEESES